MTANDISSNYDRFDPLEHQASYIFTPAGNTSEPKQPAPKRRKLVKSKSTFDEDIARENIRFGALFNGAENAECVDLRYKFYEESWGSVHRQIQEILQKSNERTLEGVKRFVNERIQPEHEDHIPTGLISTGPNVSQVLLFEQLAERLSTSIEGPVIVLQSGDAPNLKTALKKLIRSATNQLDGVDDEEIQVANKSQTRKLLNYDLQILHDFVLHQGTAKVVVAFQDSEAFDSSLLAELVAIFSSWLDRIPFVLLFGIATSVELFHERLPRAATRLMHGRRFDVEQTNATLNRVFKFAVADPRAPLKLGPNLMKVLIERQHDHTQSVQAFVASLKYAYMCHYYANPLSILLTGKPNLDDLQGSLQPEHFEAIRMLPSFRERVEILLQRNEPTAVRALLEDDNVLFHEIKTAIANRNAELLTLMQNMHILTAMNPKDGADQISLYINAYSGKLGDADYVRDLIDSLRTLSSQDIVGLLERCERAIQLGDPEGYLESFPDADTIFDNLSLIISEIDRLQKLSQTLGKPLRTKSVARQQSVRATVVGQKVELQKGKAAVSEEDAAYTKVIAGVIELLSTFFKFKDPHDMFLHEIWLYDLKSPSRDVFSPRPRFAIERALSAPHDYLGCTCCKTSREGLSATQPVTAILYQLYLEAGSLINIFDMWSAFLTIVGENCDESDERSNLVLFYRALADLKFLGKVKNSRKKTDHLAKLAWKGL